ncbi:S24 family peptidase [Pseudomonas syringae]|uniref:LexA family protein n=1 Tax=Pseudomonas syringae TaxID=317 RepID=UPI0018E625CC|nr:helix-turn-helix domain-containing protein [Pseudomonas syringae]
MITQVIEQANTCYLMGDNACFTLLGMNEPTNTLAGRVLAKRTGLGMSQQQLADRAGVSQVTIQHLESGRNLTSKKMVDIGRALGVSAEWLMSGKSDTPRELSNVGDTRQPDRYYRYPVISWVSAGNWAEAVEPYAPGGGDAYQYSDYQAKGPAFWLEVKGDSMTAPSGVSVPEGQLILVDTQADVKPGKLVIAKLSGSNEATFKKLVEDGGVRYLKPLNSAYPIIKFEEDCKIIGVAVRSMSVLP